LGDGAPHQPGRRRRDPYASVMPADLAGKEIFRDRFFPIGIAICSNVVLGRELDNGTLVKAYDLSLPGYGFYLTYLPAHPRPALIAAFAAWIKSVA
jgi:DNA-binding transcriptional LysR family regulator